jgi:hypothetical protein
VVVLIAGMGGWYLLSARAADLVTIAWSPNSPRCSGTDVRDGTSRPVITAVPGMRCAITVRVSNDAGFDVELHEITAPFVGPDTGTVVTAGNADGASGPDRLHARYDLDRLLGSGTSLDLVVLLKFNPSGCNDSGKLWVKGWPHLRFNALGLPHERSANETFAIHRSGSTPGCPHS